MLECFRPFKPTVLENGEKLWNSEQKKISDSVVYFDAGNDTEQKILSFLKNYVTYYSALLIVDNCNLSLHLELCNEVARKKSLGKSTIDGIIINTIIPIMFVYGNQRDIHKFKEKPLQLLEEIAAEKNGIIQKWNALNVSTKSAYETQALLQLKNEYCKPKKCLSCVIGNKIIRRK